MTRKTKQLELPLESSDKFRVSQGKVKTYRRCRAAYHYRYVEKIRAKRKTRALTFGSLVHKMIEREAECENPFDVLTEVDPSSLKLFAAEKAEYGDLIEDTRRIMTEYFDYWDNDPKPLVFERINGKSAEHSFDIEILKDVVWNGKIDARGKREGLRWLVEHKSFKRKPGDDDRWRNLQSVSYFRAMDMLGWPPVDGTLPIAVADAVRMHGFKQRDHKGFIAQVAGNRSKWFQRVYTRVDEDVRDIVFNEFIDTVKEMVDNHGKKRDMNIERHCSWCDYEPLCRARLQGLDYDFIKERSYEENTGGNTEEADHIIEYED